MDIILGKERRRWSRGHGPLQPALGEKIKIGVIGTAQTVEGFERWLERARNGIAGKSEKQPNLFPPFPGLENENPFRCKFEVLQSATRSVPSRDIQDIVSIIKPLPSRRVSPMKRPSSTGRSRAF